LDKLFLEKIEIGETFFGKNHGKLAHSQNLAPKIIYALNQNLRKATIDNCKRKTKRKYIKKEKIKFYRSSLYT